MRLCRVALHAVAVLVGTVASTAEAIHEAGGQQTDVYYATRVSDKFLSFTARKEASVDQFHANEQSRLQAAMAKARSSSDKAALQATVAANEESRLEAHNAFNEMSNFITTLKAAMGAKGSATSCKDLTCGQYAYCLGNQTTGNVRCLCKAGYEGDGFICNPPNTLVAHSLIQQGSVGSRSQVADVHISPIRGNFVAVAYRDVTKGGKGYVMLGHADASQIRWGEPVLFSGVSEAYGPVITEVSDASGSTQDNDNLHLIAMAFRDEAQNGTGYLISGVADTSRMTVALGPPKPFARHQAHDLVLLPLPRSHVVVLFSEHALSGPAARPADDAMYGTSLLTKVTGDVHATPEVVRKYRFAYGPVARLSAALLSPSSFVVGYRQGEGTKQKAEAACILGQMHDSELFFSPKPVSLEPDRSDIWSRSVAPVAPNTFAYTYHSGGEQLIKQVILYAEPKTHQLFLLSGPEVIAHGPTDFVGSVSTAMPRLHDRKRKGSLRLLDMGRREAQQTQHSALLTYFQKDGSTKAVARLCGVDALGAESRCRDMSWADRELRSVTGTSIDDGRLLLAFTDANGWPFYQFVGVEA